jgi:hypothetical protein
MALTVRRYQRTTALIDYLLPRSTMPPGTAKRPGLCKMDRGVELTRPTVCTSSTRPLPPVIVTYNCWNIKFHAKRLFTKKSRLPRLHAGGEIWTMSQLSESD